MTLQIVTNALALLCYAGLIRIVMRQGLRGNRTNQLFCFYLLTMALWEMAYFIVCVSPSAEMALFWYKVALAIVSGQSIIYFTFTRSFLRIEGSRKMVHVGLLVWVLTATCAMINGTAVFIDIHREVTGLFVPTFGPLLPVLAALNYFFLAYAAFKLIQAYRETRSNLQRNRIQYLLLGLTVIVLGTAANFLPRLRPYPVDVVANIINAVLIAYAILRYQLLDISFVLRKGMLYSIPTAIIGTSYFLVVYFVATLLHPTAPLFEAWTGQILLLSLATAAVTAVAVQPLKDRVQSWVDRLFFREKYDASLMLQRLSRTAASVLDLGRLTDMILDAVASTMHVERAAILLRHPDSGEFRLMAQRGLDQQADWALRKDHPVVQWLSNHDGILTRHNLELMPQFKALWGQERKHLDQVGAELFVPLKAKGSLVGIFAVGSKLSDQAYSNDEQITLATLANQTAVAIENAKLYEATLRELAERRRMERELQVLNATLEERVRQRTFELEVLYELSQKIGYTLDVGELFCLLLEDLHRVIPYDGAASLVMLDDRRELLIQPARCLSPAVQEEIQSRLLANPAQASAQTVELAPMRCLNAMPSDEAAPLVTRVGSAIEAPLVVGEEQEPVGGLLVIAEKEEVFSADHVRLLHTVANQASIAIQRLSTFLAAEQQRQENLIQRLPEGVLLLNAQGRIVLANAVGQEYLAHLTDAQVGDVLSFLAGQPLSKLLEPPPEGHICHELVSPGSPPKVFELVSQKMETGPQAGGWVLVLRDVTERKHAEEERARLEEQFRQAQKMEAVGLLAGGVAHEFNNLLTIMQGNAELALMTLESTHPPRKELSTVLRTAERAGKLTHQLLAFSRRQVLQMVRVDLNQLIQGFAQMLQPLIGEHIELKLDLAPDLGKVQADRNALEQALMNLALNARDAMPEGGTLCLQTGSVQVGDGHYPLRGEAKPGKYVRVTVADTGVGMDEATQRHLFEPFFTTKEVGKGTGLGLAMVYGVVKQHGGWIEVKSQVAKGTRFDFYLPVSEEVAPEGKAEVESPSVPRGTETILLAEDEVEVRKFAESVLERLGYRVLAVGDGEAAVEVFLANQDRIHLVILDVVMPKLSGPKAYEAMRLLRKDLPALFITGYGAEMVDLPAEIKAGIYELQKPFAVAKLGLKVREILDEAAGKLAASSAKLEESAIRIKE